MRDAPRAASTRTVKAACPYCGTGCGVVIEARGERIIAVRGDVDHPSSRGRLCPKGQALAATATEAVLRHTRLLHPLLRAGRGDEPRRVAWSTALDVAADRFAEAIAEHGPDSVAFYVSGQLLSEDYYAFNKLARALVGTNNIDSNSRLCMSSAVVAYRRTLGADGPPCSYQDLDHADCVFVIGANPAAAHPVLFGRLLESKRVRGAKLVVVDPRRSETAAAADLHLALAPGTDLYLLVALLGVMLRDGLIDESLVAAGTVGFDATARQARGLSLTEAARITALPAADIERAARWFARSPATLSLWCQGLNQSTHGSDSGAALIHLHLATGHIGRVGSGPFSLTGQPNAMGGRETGTMANLLPGHRDPASAEDRAEVARAWGIDALPDALGLSAVEIFDACAGGRIRALWIACTNPAQSLPDAVRVQAALARVPFVVVQDAFARTETTAFADLLLPAATFGERTGTSTNSERRITLSQAAVPPPGEARADWWIAKQFAQALAARIAPRKRRLFDWSDAAAVFADYAPLTAGRSLDIAGLDHGGLARYGPQQWPVRCESGLPQSTDRLYSNHRFAHPDGRARFVALALRGAAEAVSDAYPLALTTVRLRDQWHGASRSGWAASLDFPAPAVSVSPQTAAESGVTHDDLVRLATVRGSVLLPLVVDESIAPGQASVPMHYGGRWLFGAGNAAGVNALTQPAFDPLSKQPELKHAAASLEPAAFGWNLAACALLQPTQAIEAAERWRARAAHLPFACVAFCGRIEGCTGLVLQAAGLQRDAALLEWLQALLALDTDAPRLHDARAGRARQVRLEQGRLTAVLLEGRTRRDIAAAAIYRRLVGHGEDCSRRSLRELLLPAATT
jgi:assimilatory nitrate reductase catalytic subunit